VTVHGRTRTARYRRAASWEAIGEVVAAVPVPVIGNGDILFPHEIGEFRARAGCAGVMIARGALIKPWIFREAREGYREMGPEDRIAVYRRWVALAREHWGEGEKAETRLRAFLLWHLDFWARYVPRRPDGSFPRLQEREERFEPRSPLEALLARPDPAAHEWVADRLMAAEPEWADPPPPPAAAAELREAIPEG
jgi:tRNA-dihydrouridine synthase 3